MANAFYDWTEINNLYLYGSLDKPGTIDFNRHNLDTVIHMDALTFMSDGTGMFTNGAQSELVNNFILTSFVGNDVEWRYAA